MLGLGAPEYPFISGLAEESPLLFGGGGVGAELFAPAEFTGSCCCTEAAIAHHTTATTAAVWANKRFGG